MTSHLEHLSRELQDAIGGASDSTLAKATGGKWNSGQILEHLLLTYKNTNRGIAKCLEKGATLATRRTLRHRLSSLLVVNFGYMPEGRKSPERALPQGMPPGEVRSSFLWRSKRWSQASPIASAGSAPARKSWIIRSLVR